MRASLLTSLLAAPAWSFGGAGAPQQKQPNIVFALVDDLGWADVGFHGGDNGLITTPVIDSLVEKGVNLDRAYSYSWCGPSRSSLLSGRLPVHVSVHFGDELAVNWANRAQGGNGIAPGFGTMGDKMKEAGYSTVYTGKWGAGFGDPEQMPRRRGFDHFLGYLQDNVNYYTSKRTPDSVSQLDGGCEGYLEKHNVTDPFMADFWQNDGPATHLLDGETWMEEILIEETLKHIADHDEATPLFLIHAFHSVHTPLNPPEHVLAPYKDCCTDELGHDQPSRRAYAAMVTWVDTQIGRLIDGLKAKGMWDNTLLVFSSDNGGPIYPGRSVELDGSANNFPLRGGKTVDFEGGTRVASFASGPLIPEKMRGAKLEQFIHLADWYGTFAALAGVDQHDSKAAANALPEVDSVNLWPWLSGQRNLDEPTRDYLHISANTLIDAVQGYKIITGADMRNIRQPSSPHQLNFNYVAPGYVGMNQMRESYKLTQEGKLPEGLMQENVDATSLDCSPDTPCLFNVRSDPTEAQQLSGGEFEAKKEVMTRALAALNEGFFEPERGQGEDPGCLVLHQAGGVYGPWSTVGSWAQ